MPIEHGIHDTAEGTRDLPADVVGERSQRRDKIWLRKFVDVMVCATEQLEKLSTCINAQ